MYLFILNELVLFWTFISIILNLFILLVLFLLILLVLFRLILSVLFWISVGKKTLFNTCLLCTARFCSVGALLDHQSKQKMTSFPFAIAVAVGKTAHVHCMLLLQFQSLYYKMLGNV